MITVISVSCQGRTGPGRAGEGGAGFWQGRASQGRAGPGRGGDGGRSRQTAGVSATGRDGQAESAGRKKPRQAARDALVGGNGGRRACSPSFRCLRFHSRSPKSTLFKTLT